MSRISILLVEDDPCHQELISAALTDGRPHVEVHVARSGDDAVRQIRRRAALPFDCLVMDFSLPDDDAAELIPRLARAGCKCPKIVISSHGEQSIVIRAMRNGGVDFLPKIEALQPDKLWSRIDHALAKWRRRVETRRKTVRRTRKLVRLAEVDPLTGLSNRRCIDRLFRRRRAIPDRRGEASLIMIDLDHFKSVNDRFGHTCGDRVLTNMAELLRECVDPGDVACRYGGEEFLVVKQSACLADALWWAESLRGRIAASDVTYDDQRVPITASFGIASSTNAELTRWTLGCADQALYLAKRRGRNRTCTWPMASFDKVITSPDFPVHASVEERLAEVIRRFRTRIGATQCFHLTTHSADVSNMAVRLGRALDMTEWELERLRIAGLCHDLGKLIVPEKVLAKPTALSPVEQALLARHAEDGAEMAAALGADAFTTECIRLHHARHYRTDPEQGRVRLSSHLGGRVLAVADALVTMISHRSYSPGRSLSAAVHELQRASSGQFDPVVVAAVTGALLSEGQPAVARSC